MFSQATYIWIDGTIPTSKLRSKVKILKHPKGKMTLKDFPQWNFDGSSTFQASGHDSDLILVPVNFIHNPLAGKNDFLVLCEVMNPDGSPHATNKRVILREMIKKYGKRHAPWIGFEQEYTLFKGSTPLGWPDRGYPAPQGPFYCGVGADEAFGRQLVEEHTRACIDAGIMIYGINGEVMPGQWEFQIGYRNIDSESADPLNVSDHLWLARWLLYRIGEDYGISATLHPKPVKGDWNGAGKHTNFSTKGMRNKKTGLNVIKKAIQALEKRHKNHISVYGDGIEERLTGLHETASYKIFKAGVGDRGASIRIPRHVEKNGCGYLEDRRPCANADPYAVAAILMETICGAESR